MSRIPINALLAPCGIYQPDAVEARGYAPSHNARFVVVRTSKDAPWRLIHAKSGAGIDSILPATMTRITLAEKLAVASAWQAATHLDWSAFDALPQVTYDTKELPALHNPSRATLDEMRTLAANAIVAARAY
jgi:hypothetical protein